MTPREQGFLLMTTSLGELSRKPLTYRQFRTLVLRSKELPRLRDAEVLTVTDMAELGYDPATAHRIVELFSDKTRLEGYLRMAKKAGCGPLTLADENFPEQLPQRLGMDCPTVLWYKGDITLLHKPGIALVGSRELKPENLRFARQVGSLAARNGYTLVSGNARGADREAQNACLENGGQVVSIVADSLTDKKYDPNILYLSEDSFDLGFTARRALSRNRIIHAMGMKTFVAQSGFGKGGTWDGTVKNLAKGYSPVYCFDDGSPAMAEFAAQGAIAVTTDQIASII